MDEEFSQINSPEELTLNVVKHYMRIDHDLDDFELTMYLKSALSYVKKYVGKDGTDEFLDVDLIMPVLMAVAHFYENKSPVNVSNAKLDDVFSGILWMNRGVTL